MKNCATSFIFLLAVFCSTWNVRADAVQEGNAAFAKGDYSLATRSYETALSTTSPSAGLYYDLALAHLKAGEKPEAAINLRRALMLDPRMADARNALSDLEKSQGIPVSSESWQVRLAEKASLPFIISTGAVLFWIAAFLLLILSFKRARPLPWVGGFFLLLIGVALFLGGSFADPKVREVRGGVIMTGDGVTLLAAPADQSAAVAKLPAGASVQILRRSGEWTYCRTPGGEKGWMPSSAVQAIVPAT